MKYTLHENNTRGKADLGWLLSRHTFSFADYHNPERMNFGVLRVLNDDIVAGGKGFSTHRHANMEIISIPLEGDLEHKDSIGNIAVIKQGDIQVMSAGTGIFHSEYNKSQDKEVKFLQIWIVPDKLNVEPRYDQITLDVKDRHNRLQQIISPNAHDSGVWIYQQAWFHLGRYDQNKEDVYNLKDSKNGVYAFVLQGEFRINGINLSQRDGLGLWETDQLTIISESNGAEVLLIEVPLT